MVCDGSTFWAKLNIAGGLSFYQDLFYLCCVNTGVMVFKNPISLAHTACGRRQIHKHVFVCVQLFLAVPCCLLIHYFQVACLRPCLYLSVFYVLMCYENAAVHATETPAIVICC